VSLLALSKVSNLFHRTKQATNARRPENCVGKEGAGKINKGSEDLWNARDTASESMESRGRAFVL